MKKIIIAMLVFLIFCLTACKEKKNNGDAAAISDNDQSITTFGFVRCRNTKNITIPFNAGIKKVLVHEGEKVVEGQYLFQLDLSEYNKQTAAKQTEIDNLSLQIATLKQNLDAIEKRTNIQANNLRHDIASQNENLAIFKNCIETGSSPEYKKLEISLENAGKDLSNANDDLTNNKYLYDSGAISKLEYQTKVSAVETIENQIIELRLSIDALIQEYESGIRILQLSINQKENDLAVLTSDSSYEIGELQSSIRQKENLLSLAKTDMQQLKSSTGSTFIKNGHIVCDVSQAVVNSLNCIPGEVVIAGSIIANLMDTGSLYIEGGIEEQSISGVHENALVHIFPETDKSRFYMGEVSFISSLASQENGETMISVWISIENADEFLIPNTNVKVKIYSE